MGLKRPYFLRLALANKNGAILCATDEEERVAEGRASQLYCLMPGTQWLCRRLSPQATMARRFLLSVLSPLTTDLHGPSSHLQVGYSTYMLEALSQQAPLQKK